MNERTILFVDLNSGTEERVPISAVPEGIRSTGSVMVSRIVTLVRGGRRGGSQDRTRPWAAAW